MMVEMRVWPWLVIAAGCGFHSNTNADARPVDTPTDSIDAPPNATCFGSTNGLVRPCYVTVPSAALALSSALVTDPASCDSGVTGKNVGGTCVKGGTTITITGSVNVTGPNPLVLVATQSITITGQLSVASHRNNPGAGVNNGAATCSTPIAVVGQAGGVGGSFGDTAGGGGDNAATPGAAIVPTVLRAGCGGQLAGNSGAGSVAFGGGGLYLIAPSITIMTGAAIDASGGGGAGGARVTAVGYGGGGGGSGGMLVLDAPTIANNGMVYANGGGGGQGADTTKLGQPGADPSTATTAAAGGSGGQSTGGLGGAGAFVSTPAVVGGTGNSNGGGGGGGGAGIIYVFGGSALNGTVSPVPNVM
jgi:hypothetical protein